MSIIKLLTELSDNINSVVELEKEYTISNGTYNGFEKLVPNILEEIKNHGNINFSYEVFYGHHFPDLEIFIEGKKYGIELKSRKKGQWTTNGNSVFESITDEDYDEIYLLFGSLNVDGKRYSVEFRPYWQVTTGIAVTHSPRFKIDMRANDGDSVFANSLEYYTLREKNDEEKIIFLQNYLKKSSDKSKWYIPQETESIKPIHFKDLDKNIKNKVIAETFVIYPQDIIKKYPSGIFRGEYGRCLEYLLSQYFYFTTSLRDSYSAGGTFNYNGVDFPQTLYTLNKISDNILDILYGASDSFIDLSYKSWQESGYTVTNPDDFKESYFSMLNQIGNRYLDRELNDSQLNDLSAFLQIKL